MNVLVTGACGLLGAHVVARLGPRHNVVGVDRHPWWGDQPADILHGDLADTGFLKGALAHHTPELIVHCAGMVDVDACERNPGDAHFSNVEITRRLLACAPAQCRFVYISSDSVFD